MNKAVKIILNILLVLAALIFLVGLIPLAESFRYKNREVEDPAENAMMLFEYKLEHGAYGEVLSTYYVNRLSSFEAPAGFEDIYHVAEYAHTAFMDRVYTEKGDTARLTANAARLETARSLLGTYAYTADEIDAILR